MPQTIQNVYLIVLYRILLLIYVLMSMTKDYVNIYLLAVNEDTCVASCNTLNDLYSRV